MQNDLMTQSQREALAKVYHLLGEHFDRSLVAVEWEIDDDQGGTSFRAYYQGGRWAAVGLAEGAIHELKFGGNGS